MVAELSAECQMGGVILGGDDQAAGVPVDAVDDTGPLLTADAGQRIAAVMQQGVDQRAVGMARRRMHHQPHRLVHHDHVLILIHHVQRNILRLHGDLLRLGAGDFHGLAAGQTVVFRRARAVHSNAAALQQLGRRAAGQALHMGGQPRVDPGAPVFTCRRQRQLHRLSSLRRIFRRTTGSTPRPESRPPPRSSRPD